MPINVGDKFKVKPEYKNQCGTCGSCSFDYIEVLGTYGPTTIGSYDAKRHDGTYVVGCSGCYQPHMLEPYGPQGLTATDVIKAVDMALKQHTRDLEVERIQKEAYKRVLDENPFSGADASMGEDGSSYVMMGDGRVGLIKNKPASKKSTFAQNIKKLAGHRNAKLRYGVKA